MIKRLVLISLLWLLPISAFGAELLVRAKPHWMDSFTQAEVDKMTLEQKQSYGARSQIGDIIVVRPDGWQWGKEERLPNFIVVKIPNLSIDLVKQYEESLMDNTIPDKPIMLKVRKYKIPSTYVDLIKTTGGVITINKATLLSKIQAKTQ